jgi:hypothetical protein
MPRDKKETEEYVLDALVTLGLGSEIMCVLRETTWGASSTSASVTTTSTEDNIFIYQLETRTLPVSM